VASILSAEKNGEWLTLRDAAATLGVSHHQVRKLIKAGILAMRHSRSTPPHSSEAAAGVGLPPKNRCQCFQTLEQGVQNDSIIARGLMARSTVLEWISIRPSLRKIASPSR